MNKKILIAMGIVVLGLVGAAGFAMFGQRQPEQVGCTMEAKVCPDGSAVGRSGPKCEFAPCPDEGKAAAGYVAGHVTIGPVCPVERAGYPCTVPIEAYTSRDAVVYEADGVTVQETAALDTTGKYRIALDSGTYFIQIRPAGIGPGEKKKVTVTPFETSTVDFDIDTGIR